MDRLHERLRKLEHSYTHRVTEGFRRSDIVKVIRDVI